LTARCWLAQMQMYESEDAEEAGGKKRPQVRKACTNCQKAHACCEDRRPCRRCTSMGLADQCIDSERKKRGRKKKSELEALKAASNVNSDFVIDTAQSKPKNPKPRKKRSSESEEGTNQNANETKKIKYVMSNYSPETSNSASLPQQLSTPAGSPFLRNDQMYPPVEFTENKPMPAPHITHNEPSFDAFNSMPIVQQQHMMSQEYRQREEVLRQQQQISSAQVSPNVQYTQNAISSQGGDSEFVTKLLQELHSMKQRMESHSEEIKGLKTQNQILLEQLQLETHKHSAETKQNFDDLAFSYAYDNAGLAMAIITVNPPGQIISCNKSFSKLMGSMGISHVKFAQDMLYNQVEQNNHSSQWYDCYNARMNDNRGIFNEADSDQFAYSSVARVVTGNGGCQELFYHCSIVCDNTGKPIYSLACVFQSHQSRQFQDYIMRNRNYQSEMSNVYGHNLNNTNTPVGGFTNPLHQISANSVRRAPQGILQPQMQQRVDYNNPVNYRQ
jgi:PAS domain-containing protein